MFPKSLESTSHLPPFTSEMYQANHHELASMRQSLKRLATVTLQSAHDAQGVRSAFMVYQRAGFTMLSDRKGVVFPLQALIRSLHGVELTFQNLGESAAQMASDLDLLASQTNETMSAQGEKTPSPYEYQESMETLANVKFEFADKMLVLAGDAGGAHLRSAMNLLGECASEVGRAKVTNPTNQMNRCKALAFQILHSG